MPPGAMSRIYVNEIPLADRIRRLGWEVVWFFLFRPTPRWLFNGWRLLLLRSFGARIGAGCRVLPTCRIWAPWNLEMGNYSALGEGVDCYTMDRIVVGDYVTVSQRAFLCTGTHDISKRALPLTTRPIRIHDHAWICAEAFIGPGVSIGRGSVVAARAVVRKDCGEWVIVEGNPAVATRLRVLDEPTP